MPTPERDVPDIAALSGLRILLVEDAPGVADAMQSLLEDFGMTVVGSVSTPVAAEQLLAHRCPDLAVVDMHLEGQSARGLIDRLHRSNVPIVAVSGSTELPTGNARLAPLQKPFSGRELLAAIHALICTVP